MALIQFHHNSELASADVRTEQLDGKEWLVAPCVAIVAGVLNGLLVPADEIEISTMSWNGRSIPVHHPKTNTANEPMTIQNQVIGYFYAANFDTDRLKGEMWLDVNKAKALGGDAESVVTSIENGEMVEVSTAYWAYTMSQAGTFNGVPYTGITTHILPDHIAVLPGDIGACSIDDGCGLNRNREMSMKYKMLHNGEMVELELKDFGNGRKPTCHRTDNVEGMSFRDVGKALRAAVDMVTQVASDHWIWIEDIYDDYFVYEIEVNGEDSSEGLWRRDYSIAADFTVTLGEASKVVRRTVYEAAPVTPAPAMNEKTIFNQVKTFVQNLFQNHEKERNMKEKIKAIIENGATGLTAEQLAELPETAVTAMFNGLQLNEEDEPETDDGSIGGEPATPAPAADEVPAWAAALVAKVDGLAGKVDGLSATQNKAVEQQKAGIISQLVANERVTFSEDELKAFTLPQLEKFAATFIEPDYSGLFFGQNQTATGEYEEVGLTINVKEAK